MQLNYSSPFVIAPIDGFAAQIGHLVMMLNYARLSTIDAVMGLGAKDLDFMLDGRGNSIGMLLAHVAALERVYQIYTFADRPPNADEAARLKPALDLGELGRLAIRGNELSHYLHDLEEVRGTTLRELAQREDSWLYEETDWKKGQPANNYFKWLHVQADELSHRGQIRLIRRRLRA